MLRLGLHDIKNDGDPILVIVPHDSLISVCTVGCHNTVALGTVLGGLVVRHKLFDLLGGPLPDLCSDTLVKVLTDLCVAIGPIMVTVCSLDALLDITRRSLLESSCLEALFGVEEACCALTCGTILAEGVADVATPTFLIGRLELLLEHFGELWEWNVFALVEQPCEGLVAQL